jgi:hypothetical protein
MKSLILSLTSHSWSLHVPARSEGAVISFAAHWASRPAMRGFPWSVMERVLS